MGKKNGIKKDVPEVVNDESRTEETATEEVRAPVRDLSIAEMNAPPPGLSKGAKFKIGAKRVIAFEVKAAKKLFVAAVTARPPALVVRARDSLGASLS